MHGNNGAVRTIAKKQKYKTKSFSHSIKFNYFAVEHFMPLSYAQFYFLSFLGFFLQEFWEKFSKRMDCIEIKQSESKLV